MTRIHYMTYTWLHRTRKRGASIMFRCAIYTYEKDASITFYCYRDKMIRRGRLIHARSLYFHGSVIDRPLIAGAYCNEHCVKSRSIPGQPEQVSQFKAICLREVGQKCIAAPDAARTFKAYPRRPRVNLRQLRRIKPVVVSKPCTAAASYLAYT